MKACQQCHGVETEDSSKNAQQMLENSISTYSPFHHRAIVAVCCAASHHLFNSLADPYYLKEVELLHPGTVIPSPQTVSHDVQAIYQEASKHIKEYFSVSGYLSDIFLLTIVSEIQWSHTFSDGWMDCPFHCILPWDCNYMV
jgi:hypothetical protein